MKSSGMLSPRALAPVMVNFPSTGIFVFESRHSRGFRMTDTSHDYWKVLYVNGGRGCLRIGNQKHPLEADYVVLVPPGLRHRIEDQAVGPLTLYAVCIQKEVVARIHSAERMLGGFRCFHRPLWAREVKELLRRLLIEQARPAAGYEAFLTGFAWQLLGTLGRAVQSPHASSSRKDPMAATKSTAALTRKRVEVYWQELPLNFSKASGLDQEAEKVGLGRRRFSQLFRKASGRSWLQAIRELRIQYARRLLTETTRTAAAIAFESGFEDLTHFYRVFKEYSGTTPEKWRQSQRPGQFGR